ncbi:MAG: 3-deoxy-8-phosphooctulonate synthase, partial [Alphaproteobacteria bacterium]|nr:3-deoxy-8-phosphooctulonate synthase [Alphaproteobacteria bacterium]
MENNQGNRTKSVNINGFVVANDKPMALLAGPCALESRDVAFRCAEHLVKVAEELKMPFVFKSSFDKANRTSLNAKRGVKMDEALRIFADIKKEFTCSIVTDVHESYQCSVVADVVDVLQIPAFLCRQTDLLVSAAKTGKVIEIKKGQFLAPWDMKHVYEKVEASGNNNILLCERGT